MTREQPQPRATSIAVKHYERTGVIIPGYQGTSA
jgi:hypothetical protein